MYLIRPTSAHRPHFMLHLKSISSISHILCELKCSHLPQKAISDPPSFALCYILLMPWTHRWTSEACPSSPWLWSPLGWGPGLRCCLCPPHTLNYEAVLCWCKSAYRPHCAGFSPDKSCPLELSFYCFVKGWTQQSQRGHWVIIGFVLHFDKQIESQIANAANLGSLVWYRQVGSSESNWNQSLVKSVVNPVATTAHCLELKLVCVK